MCEELPPTSTKGDARNRKPSDCSVCYQGEDLGKGKLEEPADHIVDGLGSQPKALGFDGKENDTCGKKRESFYTKALTQHILRKYN